VEEENALIPLDEKKIAFYDDEIVTTLVSYNGQSQMYVPLRPICEHLGLSWTGQRERIHRDPVLEEEAKFVRLTRPVKNKGSICNFRLGQRPPSRTETV
jgi:P22_AR N-terminal domain